MRSTTPAATTWQAALERAVADAGAEPGVTVLPFGSLAAGAERPRDVDLALVYEPGRRAAALRLRERLRAAVGRHLRLPCDFVVVSRAEAEHEREDRRLRDDLFRDLPPATARHR